MVEVKIVQTIFLLFYIKGTEEASVTSNAGAEQNNPKLREFSIPLQVRAISYQL